MKIYVARHGETDYNVQELDGGVTDIPLNEKGWTGGKAGGGDGAISRIWLMIVSPLTYGEADRQPPAGAGLRRI